MWLIMINQGLYLLIDPLVNDHLISSTADRHAVEKIQED